MSNSLIAFIFSIGFSGWVYAKIQKTTGGNTQTAIIVAAGSALVAFLLVMIILGFVPDNS